MGTDGHLKRGSLGPHAPAPLHPSPRVNPRKCFVVMQHNGAILAWARDPKGYERVLGELVAQFQYNYDVRWQSWVYSDWQQDDSCTALRDYKVRHIPCDTLLSFACERGESRFLS